MSDMSFDTARFGTNQKGLQILSMLITTSAWGHDLLTRAWMLSYRWNGPPALWCTTYLKGQQR
jgi:hypothetical protein